jgi:hypothetical protein
MPSTNRVLQIHTEKGIAILAVNVDGNEDTTFKFAGDDPVEFPVLHDQNG